MTQGLEIKLRKGGSIEGVVVIEDPTDPAMSEKTGKITCMFYVRGMALRVEKSLFQTRRSSSEWQF